MVQSVFSVEEVARLLGIYPTTVRNWIEKEKAESGKGLAAKMVGTRFEISFRAFVDFKGWNSARNLLPGGEDPRAYALALCSKRGWPVHVWQVLLAAAEMARVTEGVDLSWTAELPATEFWQKIVQVLNAFLEDKEGKNVDSDPLLTAAPAVVKRLIDAVKGRGSTEDDVSVP